MDEYNCLYLDRLIRFTLKVAHNQRYTKYMINLGIKKPTITSGQKNRESVKKILVVFTHLGKAKIYIFIM